MRKYFSIFSILVLSSICSAVGESNNGLCPVKRFIEPLSPMAMSERFSGDTITFVVPDAENVLFESFKLLHPDTIWLKERPTNKLPQEHKHFKLVTKFTPVSGWGVNSHRQYTPGTALEQNQFIFRGSHSETVQYLGTFNYIVIEDVASGKYIKWDYTKNENKGLIIFAPSMLRHLSLMKGLDFIVEKDDSTFVPAKCVNVSYSISVKPKVWIVNLDADFSGNISSHNWSPRFFLKKDEDKIVKQ